MKWALRIENNLVINLSVLKNVSTLLHKNSEVLIPPKFMELIQENNHKWEQVLQDIWYYLQ